MRTTRPYRFTSRIIRNKYPWQEIILIVLALVWIRVLGCIMESGGGNHWIDLTFGMRLSRSAATVLVKCETYNITQRQNHDCARSYTEVFYSAYCSWYWNIFISAPWFSPWSLGDVAMIAEVKTSFCQIAVNRKPESTFNDKSMLFPIMVWCRQAANFYLSPC